MNIKLLSVISLLTVLNTDPVSAQVQVGSSESISRPGNLTEQDLEALKSTTTIFVLRTVDKAQKEDFEKTISSAWKITPFKVIPVEELKQYAHNKAYSICTFGLSVRTRTSVSIANDAAAYFTYELRLPGQVGKKGKIKEGKLLSRFLLMHDPATANGDLRPVFMGSTKKKHVAKAIDAVHTKIAFYNWGPGFIKGYIKTMNDLLTSKTTNYIFSNYVDQEHIAKMANDTLYIPSYVNNKFGIFTGERKQNTTAGMDEDTKNFYPYPVQYISAAALDQKILSETEPFHYLIFTRNPMMKYISVFSSEGNVSYTNRTDYSFNFKNTDLVLLAKAIRN